MSYVYLPIHYLIIINLVNGNHYGFVVGDMAENHVVPKLRSAAKCVTCDGGGWLVRRLSGAVLNKLTKHRSLKCI